MTADGSLIMKLTRHFVNSFAIRMTNYGASLLGINKSRLREVGDHIVNRVTIPTKFLAFTQNQNIQFVDPTNNNVLLAGQNTSDQRVDMSVPIYQSSDQRLKVSVSSHLPISNNIRIDDTRETVDRDICEAFFESTLQVEIDYNQDDKYAGSSIKSKVYNGQHNFIKKSDRHSQYVKLLTSYMLQYYRFYLKITYREFTEETASWKLSTKKLPVPENSYWLMVIKFVSDI